MSPNAHDGRRRLAALVVVATASVASVASLDMNAPVEPSTGGVTGQSAVLNETAPPVPVTVHVHSTQDVDSVALTIHLTARWTGFEDLDFEDAGAPDLPIVEARLAGGGEPDAAETLDRAITTSPGMGALRLTTDGTCAGTHKGCGSDFTFTLARVEPVRSGTVTVTWSATATVLSDSGAVVTVSVTP